MKDEICGDVPLTSTDRLRYVVRGLGELATSLRARGKARPWPIDPDWPEAATKIAEGASPWRVYASAFLAVETRILPRHGRVVDIGSGSGGQARFFADIPGARYIGVDVSADVGRPNRGTLSAGGFIQTSAEALGLRDGIADMVISSSTLEHLGDQHAAIREATRVTRTSGRGIHLVPGTWSLFLYGFHGYRRFSPASLADLFRPHARIVAIWSFGGLASFALHILWITATGDRARRGGALRLYRALLRAALIIDRWAPLTPVGYAVVVETG